MLDTNVLYPPLLRDVLVELAVRGAYCAVWSDETLLELERNLARRMSAQVANARVRFLREQLPEAEIRDYAEFLSGLRNDPKDRHVLAAALKANAEVIITMNVKDFIPRPESVSCLTPDEQLVALWAAGHHNTIRDVLEDIRLSWPDPVVLSVFLERLKFHAPVFASFLENW